MTHPPFHILTSSTMHRRAGSQTPPPSNVSEDEGNSTTAPEVLTINNDMISPAGDVQEITSSWTPAPLDDIPRDWNPWSAPTSIIDNGIWPWAQEVSNNPRLYTRPFPHRPIDLPAPLQAGATASEVYWASTVPESAELILWCVRNGDTVVAGNVLRAATEHIYEFMTHECSGTVFREFLRLRSAEDVDLLAGAACRDVESLLRVACHQYGCYSVQALVGAAVRICYLPVGKMTLWHVARALGNKLIQLSHGGPYGAEVIKFCLTFPEIREFLPWKNMHEHLLRITAAGSVPEAMGGGFGFTWRRRR